MSAKNCQICGNPSGFYPLCKEHLEKKKNGLVVKNESTGLWEEVKPKEELILEQENGDKCPLCGTEIDGTRYKLCMDCHYNVLDRIDELDKNQKPFKLKDYYYNAKDYALKLFDEDKIYYQELTMFAISDILQKIMKMVQLVRELIKIYN